MQSSNAPANQAVIRKMKPIILLLTCIAITLSGCAASSKSPASYLGIDSVNTKAARIPLESDNTQQAREELLKRIAFIQASKCLEDVDRLREALEANSEETKAEEANVETVGLAVDQIKKPTADMIALREDQCKKSLEHAIASKQSLLSHLPSVPLGTVVAGAQSGDRHAQLELGIRFEEGSGGVTRDIKKAKKFYRKAAQESGGRIWVYSPPVGGSPGRTIPLDTGPKEYGLPEAIKRLEALEE